MSEEKRRAIAEIETIANQIAAELGLEIVEFIFHSQGRHSQLRIDIDRPGVPGVGLADCERLSRTLGERIEDDPRFQTPYELQVSSPGIDRPIRTAADVRRNVGRRVRAEFRDEAEKLREVRGILAPTSGADAVTILAEDGEFSLAFDRIVLLKQDAETGGRKRKNA